MGLHGFLDAGGCFWVRVCSVLLAVHLLELGKNTIHVSVGDAINEMPDDPFASVHGHR